MCDSLLDRFYVKKTFSTLSSNKYCESLGKSSRIFDTNDKINKPLSILRCKHENISEDGVDKKPDSNPTM